MSTRKFRALTDGPGWKKGDVFDYFDREPNFSRPWYSPTGKTYPAFPESVMEASVDYFEELKPRKIAVYEIDVTDSHEPAPQLWFLHSRLKLVKVEDRE